MNDTITIDGVTYGPPIPHDPTPVKLSDGTVVQPVCPWPDVVGVYQMRSGTWDHKPCRLSWLRWNFTDYLSDIMAYRLPADHHAYGDRRSRRGEPDRWMNAYPSNRRGGMWRSKEDCDNAANYTRIAIWRIYKKGEAK